MTLDIEYIVKSSFGDQSNPLWRAHIVADCNLVREMERLKVLFSIIRRYGNGVGQWLTDLLSVMINDDEDDGNDEENKTIKDGYIAPWKDLKRFEGR